MEIKTKKQASDYQQMLLRPSVEDKELIEALIESLLITLNSNLAPRQKKFKKNDVAIEAMKLGLAQMKSEIRERKN
jgi:hypothetical protein